MVAEFLCWRYTAYGLLRQILVCMTHFSVDYLLGQVSEWDKLWSYKEELIELSCLALADIDVVQNQTCQNLVLISLTKYCQNVYSDQSVSFGWTDGHAKGNRRAYIISCKHDKRLSQQ
jgi:hypothetical protein